MSAPNTSSSSNLSANALSERSARAWLRFRAWPAWAQAVAWIVGWVVVLPIWAWRSRLGTRSKIAVTLVALIVFVATAAAAATAPSRRASARAAPVTPSTVTSPAEPLRPTEMPTVPTTPPTITPTTKVPSVVGESFKEAEKALASRGLLVQRKDKVDDSVPAGTVLAQSTAAGTRVAVSSSVVLTVATQSDTPKTVECPSDPLRGVYHSYRLHVLATCQWFVGTVVAIRPEDDGDHHIDIAPDKGYSKYLNDGDRQHQSGGLLIETMPGQKLPLPSVGDHVSVFGTWVYDADHGWNEIHPIWAMNYLDSGTLLVALPPATPQYEPDSGGSGGSGDGGGSANCDPNYTGYCLKDGVGDWDCADGGGNGPNYVPVKVRVVGSDPFGLDSNGDGYGCDTL